MATSKAQAPSLWTRIKRPFISISKFLREVWNELQRVIWPTHEETYGFTIVVIICVIVVAAWVGVWDFMLSQVVRLLGI